MNQLQHETSPYLLQHVHNPVNWYAWKPAAFKRAIEEDKPILVSIGYSTCHWCHVMERESFEDKEVAEFMNEHFICIKVDREERPDVDQIYMEACQVLTGGGGWPLNCFLTPDKRPFYAGTYYPPMPAHNRPSWLQVLMNISHAFQNKRDTVEDQANRLTHIIKNSGKNFTGNQLTIVSDESPFKPKVLDKLYEGLRRSFDKKEGGFGGAPKFPGSMSLSFLLGYHYHQKNQEALDHVLLSLDKMSMGGIYDHIGGGFSRYTVDEKWLVPHFEKMLYDNALLVGLLADAYKITKKELYRSTIEETLTWVAREMTHPEGGFYAAQDADSEGVEGKYYVWDRKEINEILGSDAVFFNGFYDISEKGNWEGHNIVNRKYSYDAFAEMIGAEPDFLKSKLSAAKVKLFNVRDQRIHPGLDDKILLDWNALMCTAYAKAYSALGVEAYKEAALRNMTFLQKHFRKENSVQYYHTYKKGTAQYDAFLDDYAFMIEALIELHNITYDTEYLTEAGRLTDYVLEQFQDKGDHLFFFTSSDQKDVPIRRKDLYDSATPSGNATMVRNLQQLGILLGKEAYRDTAVNMLTTMKSAIVKYPSSFSRWSAAIMDQVAGLPEIAVVGSTSFEMAKEINSHYWPVKTLMATNAEQEHFPLLAGKSTTDDTWIYLCQDYACRQPVKTIDELRQLLVKD